jgi:hypothetical protein
MKKTDFLNNPTLLQMERMRKNNEVKIFGLTIGNCTPEFEHDFIQNRGNMLSFFGGATVFGLGTRGEWILDLSQFFHFIEFPTPPQTDADYIHFFIKLLDCCIIEELIHALTRISHFSYSGEAFMQFITQALGITREGLPKPSKERLKI